MPALIGAGEAGADSGDIRVKDLEQRLTRLERQLGGLLKQGLASAPKVKAHLQEHMNRIEALEAQMRDGRPNNEH